MKTTNTRRVWQVVGMGVLMFALVIGSSIYTNKQSTSTEPAIQETSSGTVSLTIGGFYENRRVSIASGDTVLNILRTLNTQDPKLQLSIKEYPGLGVLVEDMYEQKNGTGGNYWQYKVNGIMPQIGADSYTLKDSDSVEWFFGPSEF